MGAYELPLRATALLIASVPATSWGDVLPKVTIVALLRAEGESAASHQLIMLEAAIARDHRRLQIPLDGDDALH